MTSWEQLKADLVFRIQLDFTFQLRKVEIENVVHSIFDYINERVPPRIKGEPPSDPPRRGPDSGLSSASSIASVEDVEEWWKWAPWTAKEVNATLLDYCAHMLDSSYVNGRSPVGKIVCSHHKVHRFSNKHWTLSRSPQIEPYDRLEEPRTYLRLTSTWHALSQMPTLLEQLDEIQIILDDDPKVWPFPRWFKHDGWPGTHGHSAFPNSRLVVGFNTSANVASKPTPQQPSWATALNLFCTWHVFGDAIRRRWKPATGTEDAAAAPDTAPSTLQPSNAPDTAPSTLQPSNAPDTAPSTLQPSTAPDTDAQAVFDAIYACTTPEALLDVQQAPHGDLLAFDPALNATTFLSHPASLDGPTVQSWVNTASVMYLFAQTLDARGQRLSDVLPAGTRGDWDEFRELVGSEQLD